MFDRPIERMSKGVSGNSRDVFWASYRIEPHLIELIGSGDMDHILEHAWQDVGYAAAKSIFEKIKDGRLYSLRVRRFEHNFDLVDAARYSRYSGPPPVYIGYKGTLSLVQTEPFRAVPKMEPSPLGRYREPRWREIGDGIRERLRKDFKPNNLMKWAIKNVLARVLYMPDENPDFWGRDAF